MELILGWVLFAILTIIIIILLYLYFGKKRYVVLLPLPIIAIFYFYSFFTVEGSVRLGIALMGHPVIAYTSPLIENEEMKNADHVFFTTEKDIQLENNRMGYLECQEYFIIKISKYYGY